ncbi:SiaB family protein kinase [Sediminibacterium sp.]|uniref:SiaB family protein kinase n=1 Tax=Sediminibacterium sp. TaxID=1917865 RepID=UPI0027332431|nr:SiaB family protein kinase [Sediminibacterium sp.]MDP3567286.1 SiaB family protein kinase [Sediminibacterium sp.]
MSLSKNEKYLTIAELFNILNNFQLNYAYSGDFTNDLTERILSLAETNMEVESESLKMKKKVYFIIVESLQNITRHQGVSKSNGLMDGFFSIHKFSGGYLIGSGNTIENKNIESLSQKLEKVNSLNAEELKEYQKSVLSAGDFSEKGGAGLGLIEIVRKSGNKLSYDFINVDSQNSYFYFQAKITEATDLNNNPEEKTNYDIVKNVHKVVTDNNLKIFFQGQFKHENVRSLLSMAEGSIYLTEKFNFKKTSVAIMIELLQNISYHATGINNTEDRPGLFMVADNNNICSLITGNYIENPKINELIKRIDYVNSLDDQEIEKLYLETIVMEQDDNRQGAGLGFIDIRIKSKNKIEVEMIPYTENKTFIIIRANISY